jgi:hypothetical protein
MAHFDLHHVNFPNQVKPHAPAPSLPNPQNLPIKKGERGEGRSPLACHNEWKEKFLGEGETISIPLREEKGGMLKIPRQEIVSCMEKLYQSRMLIDPNESQQGIYEEAKCLVISRYLKKEGIVKNGRR